MESMRFQNKNISVNCIQRRKTPLQVAIGFCLTSTDYLKRICKSSRKDSDVKSIRICFLKIFLKKADE